MIADRYEESLLDTSIQCSNYSNSAINHMSYAKIKSTTQIIDKEVNCILVILQTWNTMRLRKCNYDWVIKLFYALVHVSAAGDLAPSHVPNWLRCDEAKSKLELIDILWEWREKYKIDQGLRFNTGIFVKQTNKLVYCLTNECHCWALIGLAALNCVCVCVFSWWHMYIYM